MRFIIFEESFHDPKLNEGGRQQEDNFDNTCPLDMRFWLFQSSLMGLISFNMELLVAWDGLKWFVHTN